MTHEGFLLRTPARGVHALTSRITAEDDLFLVTHMGLAQVDRQRWTLDISGLLRKPCRLSLGDLATFPRHEVVSVHECAGSPLTPLEPKRRVGNVAWSGVRLADVLESAGVSPEATFVWSEGLEWGEFAGVREPFVKDLPVSKAMSHEVLLATHLNGEPLSDERGGPVRLVVPGWYGTNSVKWIGRIVLADRRAPGPYTTRFYNDPTDDGPKPVWGIAPESIIVSPAPDAVIHAGDMVDVNGWAWAEAGVSEVRIGWDGGRSWMSASLEPREGFAWQRFTASWLALPGRHVLTCHCIDGAGRTQPVSGARNAIHSVTIEVTPSRRPSTTAQGWQGK